jgi:hypothetical protein
VQIIDSDGAAFWFVKIYERVQQTCNFVQNNLNTRACKFEQSARNSSSKFQTPVSRSATNPTKFDGARKESADLPAVVKAFVEWVHEKPTKPGKLLDLLKRADMAIEDAEESARAIRFECWDSSRPPVYFATEKKAFDWVKEQGWILGSKCWSYWPNASEARITVYASEDDKNYGDIFDHEGHLIRPVAAFRALLNACPLPIGDSR